MLIVGLGNWIRRLLSSGGRTMKRPNARVRPSRSRRGELEQDRVVIFAGAEAATAAESALAELKAPRDPAP
jgi:hypothetical protein